MPYLPNWEPLGAALRRLLESGVGEPEAQRDLCSAIADRAIAVRVTIDPAERNFGGQVLESHRIQVPEHLNPTEFDWARSRPLTKWWRLCGLYSLDNDRAPRAISFLELWREDVTCSARE